MRVKRWGKCENYQVQYMNKLYLVYSGWRNRITLSHSVGKTVHEVPNPVTFVLMISIGALNWRLCIMTGKCSMWDVYLGKWNLPWKKCRPVAAHAIDIWLRIDFEENKLKGRNKWDKMQCAFTFWYIFSFFPRYFLNRGGLGRQSILHKTVTVATRSSLLKWRW